MLKKRNIKIVLYGSNVYKFKRVIKDRCSEFMLIKKNILVVSRGNQYYKMRKGTKCNGCIYAKLLGNDCSCILIYGNNKLISVKELCREYPEYVFCRW